MRIFNHYTKSLISLMLLSSIASILILMLSCNSEEKQEKNNDLLVEKENVIEIVTKIMDFQMADTIPSGWNTFRYKNASSQTHFFIIDKYPEGKNSEDLKKLVSPVFDSAMKLISEGKAEEGFAEFANLPEWYGEVRVVGGSGLLSPNQVGTTTFNLKPGNYIIECYVKMSNGIFHTSMGMTKDIVVIDKDSRNKELIADIPISISSTEGIVFNDSINSGTHTFSVFYKDQTVHENFVGHDVNLVKLDENSDLTVLEKWMNWADPKGLIEPAPSGFTFLGGINDMPQGSTGYFTATLEKGKYALVSEVPNTLSKNMLKTFVVE